MSHLEQQSTQFAADARISCGVGPEGRIARRRTKDEYGILATADRRQSGMWAVRYEQWKIVAVPTTKSWSIFRGNQPSGAKHRRIRATSLCRHPGIAARQGLTMPRGIEGRTL